MGHREVKKTGQATPLSQTLGLQRQADLVQGQPVLRGKFQASQSSTVRPCVKTKYKFEEACPGSTRLYN